MAYESTTTPLDTAPERINAIKVAGDEYVGQLESIRDTLDAEGETGTTLGTMVSAQLQMTEAETKYMIRSGIPKKVSSTVQAAASDVKKAGG